jgi:hypothetical protein
VFIKFAEEKKREFVILKRFTKLDSWSQKFVRSVIQKLFTNQALAVGSKI